MDTFMTAAFAEAQQSLQEGGIPIGAVLVRNNEIIGRGHNQCVQRNDPTAHAEIECLRNAGHICSYKDTILYTTHMPCYFCAGAIVQFGIETVVVGDSSTFQGAVDFMKDHWVRIYKRDEDECRQILQNFIKNHPQRWDEDIGQL